MAWQGSPTAVTACPVAGPVPAPKRPESSSRWATEVSWYSSSSTTRNSSRRIRPTSGRVVARVAERAIWSPKSRRSRRRFSRAVGGDEVEQFQAAAGGLGDLAQIGVGELHAVEGGQQLGVVGAERGGVHEMLGELGVEGEEVLHEGGQGVGERRIGAGGGAQDAGGELEAGGVGEEPGAGLQADPQAVVLEELAGEGVVGGDPRLAGGLVGGGAGGVGRGASGSVTPAARSATADAFGELAGGLVRERQPEDLLGGDLAGADQPHHAGGHHRGLARTGSGHDDLRGGRGGDARRLLRRERDAEELFELLGVGEAS